MRWGNARVVRLLALAGVAAAITAAAGGGMVILPGRSWKGALPPLSAEESALRGRLRGHVVALATEIGERNTGHYHALQRAAGYLRERFRELGLPVRDESYLLAGKEMSNVEAELKGSSRPQEIVVVGAHYDSVPGSPGANDNASGVAALLELARLLKGARPERTIRFVGFVNEEPPYFQTESMGSVVYARRARERREKIVAMLALETIGYYSEHPGSQQYPPPLGGFYPDTGDFIGFVSDLGSAKLLRRAVALFRKSTQFPSEGVAGPGWITGIGWSDHWAFSREGYAALMVTDTAPFRYPDYHEPGDTPGKLDYERMARVVKGIERVVAELARR